MRGEGRTGLWDPRNARATLAAVLAASLAALALAGVAYAADLETLEGESMTESSVNATPTTSAMKFTGNARVYKTRTKPVAGSSIALRIKAGTTADTRVCFQPRINDVLKGVVQCIGASATTYVVKEQTVSVPEGAKVGVDVTEMAGDVAFLDHVVVKGDAPPPPPDADNDGVPDSSDNCPSVANASQSDVDLDLKGDACDVQGHGGYDDALTHESMVEMREFVAWLDKRAGYSAKGYIGEVGWPQNTSRNREDLADEEQWNALAETWLRRADKENLNATVQETSERYADQFDGGTATTVYMQCGNEMCPNLTKGNKPLALMKEGFQAQVIERHLSTPTYFRGTNFSGGQRWDEGIHTNTNPGVRNDLGDYHYPTTEAPATYNNVNSFQYLKSQGIDTIRLGVRWERIQPTLNGPLNADEMAKVDEMIANAGAANLKVVLDLHNYGGYWAGTEGGCDATGSAGGYDPTPSIAGTGKLCLGSPQLGSAEFNDVWKKLSARYGSNPTVAVYDLMNEPSGKKGISKGSFATEGKAWESLTTSVVNAIRGQGDDTTILVPSVEAGLEATPDAEAHPDGPWITNQPNLLWGAHQYFDHYAGSGTGGGKYERSYNVEDADSDDNPMKDGGTY